MNCEPPLWLQIGVFGLVGLFFLGIVVRFLPTVLRETLEEWDEFVALLRRRGE